MGQGKNYSLYVVLTIPGKGVFSKHLGVKCNILVVKLPDEIA